MNEQNLVLRPENKDALAKRVWRNIGYGKDPDDEMTLEEFQDRVQFGYQAGEGGLVFEEWKNEDQSVWWIHIYLPDPTKTPTFRTLKQLMVMCGQLGADFLAGRPVEKTRGFLKTLGFEPIDDEMWGIDVGSMHR